MIHGGKHQNRNFFAETGVNGSFFRHAWLEKIDLPQDSSSTCLFRFGHIPADKPGQRVLHARWDGDKSIYSIVSKCYRD